MAAGRALVRSAERPTAERAYPSDEALVDRAARADADAVAQLHDRFGAAAYGLALGVVGDPVLAESVVARSFVALRDSARADSVPQAGSARGRFLVLVHREAVAQARHAYRPSSGSRTMGTPHRELPRSATDLLARIPVSEREALALVYYEGRSRSEAAELIDTSSEAVGRLLTSGLRRLRQFGEDQVSTAPSGAKIVAPTRTRVAPSSAATR